MSKRTEITTEIMDKVNAKRDYEKKLAERNAKAKAYSTKIRREKENRKNKIEFIISAIIGAPLFMAFLCALSIFANLV